MEELTCGFKVSIFNNMLQSIDLSINYVYNQVKIILTFQTLIDITSVL